MKRHVRATGKRRKCALESDGLICARHQLDPGATPKEPALDSIEPVERTARTLQALPLSSPLANGNGQ